MRFYIKPFSLLCITLATLNAFAEEDKPRSLGNGFPGVTKKIEASEEMSAALAESGTILYSYTRAQIAPEDARIVEAACPTNSIAFIAHQPKKLGRRLLPMIVELKIVPDNELSPSLINKNLFSAINTDKLKKQVKKDFVAMSILVPESLRIKSSTKGERTEPSKLAMDAILSYTSKLGSRCVNTNQIFVVTEDTNAIDEALDFFVQYPNRFSLLICKDTIPNTGRLNYLEDEPGKISIYHPSNVNAGFLREAESFKYRIEKEDGEFELFKYDSSSENAWDNPELIKWMLTHTTDGIGLVGNKKAKYDPKNPTFINGIKCSTSEEICPQKKFWPLAAVDNNEKTYFQSANMVEKDGWWMAEFEKPIEGRVTIQCGILKRRKLEHLYGNIHVEVSADGKKWQTKGIISKKKGSFSYIENTGKIKFIRVISRSMQEVLLTVRELTIEEL